MEVETLIFLGVQMLLHIPNIYILVLTILRFGFEILIVDGSRYSLIFCYIETCYVLCFVVLCSVIMFEFSYGRVIFDRYHRPFIELY